MNNFKSIFAIALLLLGKNIFAQNVYPAFETGTVEFRFPATMIGLMKDSAHKVEADLAYTLQGQKFEGTAGHIQTTAEGFNGKTKKATPWQTLTELTAAQQAKNLDAIMALYTPESKSEFDRLITPDNKQQVLDYFGQIKTVNVLCGFEYKNGYVAILDMKEMGLNNVFFVKVKKKWMVAAIKEAGPMIWNISLAYKFKPEPTTQPTLTTPFDSMEAGGTQKLTFKLNKPGNYVTLFRNKLGEAVLISLKDGMPNDSNSAEGLLEVTIRNTDLKATTEQEFYYAETNYPVKMVTDGLMKGAGVFRFRLYRK